MADSKEAQFQQDIIDALAAQGWLVGTASGCNRRMVALHHQQARCPR
jgi:type I restriction enzyme R subunit